MTLDLLAALAGFALVSSISPGPNNLMLMASGVNFGFRRSIPHMLGITLGFALMVLVVGLGVARVFDVLPILDDILYVVCVAYLGWLAFKIATAAPPPSAPQEQAGRPLTFLQAAMFQWVNPKAWVMSTSAVAVYAPDSTLPTVVVVSLVFAAMSVPAVTSWTAIGQRLSRFLDAPRRLRTFNIAMAVLLVVSVVPTL
ncbi:MAG: LysE family transporter [Deinococcus-Thermus bacterium]|jgi:threonine/homoserine/homoserine lactone efflux protein|nr:LysE family transporter [Deinococcota bacterium]